MDVIIQRLDPNVPDPVESRRSAAGRLVRFTYAMIVFGVVAFFVVHFGAPLVYLGGAGAVLSPRYTVSLPYVARIDQISVKRGATVKPGDVIAQVQSPQHDDTVATYMRALVEIDSRRADLRIKVRVARDSLEVARSYLQLTEDAVERIKDSAAASLTYRVDMFRERAQAQKAVVSQEAEIAETAIQLTSLDELGQRIRDQFNEVERSFAGGKISTPVAGIVSTNLANVGQSLIAGAPIAEILDQTELIVIWYIPNERLIDPKVGNDVLVLFGNRRISGTIVNILPVSDVAPSLGSITRERTATQVARIRLDPSEQPPPLESTVSVHMHYTDLSSRISTLLIRLFGLGQT